MSKMEPIRGHLHFKAVDLILKMTDAFLFSFVAVVDSILDIPQKKLLNWVLKTQPTGWIYDFFNTKLLIERTFNGLLVYRQHVTLLCCQHKMCLHVLKEKLCSTAPLLGRISARYIDLVIWNKSCQKERDKIKQKICNNKRLKQADLGGALE